ncbi:uncharacterized protein AB675_3321 [Cyphellophora attinorum]|uniref:F-box domain-containing protein n=1 Tax=Cyphellophora attinorum TaxID=1664694 RepID=A0A0N1HAG9_9EURO|nr:uncharacterized protein AB675_3321 [Phialophora attinorum]KPI39633.1 hypothetical protein AB675_3321 [Phialophora attinorum]
MTGTTLFQHNTASEQLSSAGSYDVDERSPKTCWTAQHLCTFEMALPSASPNVLRRRAFATLPPTPSSNALKLAQSSQQSCKLLDAPPEIRQMIYRFLFGVRYTLNINEHRSPRTGQWVGTIESPSILRVCHQIRDEALAILGDHVILTFNNQNIGVPAHVIRGLSPILPHIQEIVLGHERASLRVPIHSIIKLAPNLKRITMHYMESSLKTTKMDYHVSSFPLDLYRVQANLRLNLGGRDERTGWPVSDAVWQLDWESLESDLMKVLDHTLGNWIGLAKNIPEDDIRAWLQHLRDTLREHGMDWDHRYEAESIYFAWVKMPPFELVVRPMSLYVNCNSHAPGSGNYSGGLQVSYCYVRLRCPQSFQLLHHLVFQLKRFPN